MDLQRYSIEYFSKNVIGLNLNQIGTLAKETHTNVQYSDRLFKDRYLVTGQGLRVVLYNDEPLVIRRDELKVYLVDISDGNFMKIYEEKEKGHSIVGLDVSFDKQTILIMTIFDDFPKVSFIGEKNYLDIDSRDLIDMPIDESTGNPRWWKDDEDIIVFYNRGFDKFSSIRIDWKNNKAYYEY